MKRILGYLILGLASLFAASVARAADLQVPKTVTAGSGLSIPTSGSGSEMLYLFGPASAIKRKVDVGGNVQIEPDEVKSAGFYTVVIGDQSASFYVTAASPANVAFLARPSRVAAARPGAISGSAFVFDQFNNLVLEPAKVNFTLSVEGASPVQRSEISKSGVAWTKMDSGKKAGAAQFVASVNDVSVRRVVQETAAEPCNIRMKAQRGKDGNILVETDPIHDCSGNPVPDGTIVTFTSVDKNGRSTVDSRIKKGIAQATLPAADSAQISVASGVVVGNEIRWGGGQ
jgi:hypothetical protein